MTKPTTVAALAIVVCIPALISFASGNMPAFDLGLWYLAALVVIGAGAHVLQRLVSRYSEMADRAAKTEGEGEGE